MRTMVLCGLFIAFCGRVGAEPAQIRISQQQIDNLDVRVAPLAAGSDIPLFYAPARVAVPADREALVASSVAGLVTRIHVNIGDRVVKGQALATLNSPELVGLQQAYLTAGSEHSLADIEQNRDQKLLREGVIAERRFQETEVLHGSKSAKADEARQLLELAGMSAGEIKQLATTKRLNNQLAIRSPLDGVVLERLVALGSRLDMQTPLFRVADLSQLWLEINIPQERLAQVKVGDSVGVEDTGIVARIVLLGQSVNRDNQTVAARAVLEGKTEDLRVGQSVNVKLLRGGGQTGFRVPNTALAQNEGHSYLFVRNAEGFAVTEVAVAGKQADATLVTGPLTGNEQIAVKGAVALKANWLGLGSGE